MPKTKVPRKDPTSDKSTKPSRISLDLAFTIALFCVASVTHYHHISSLFENDRFFSHLSTLEREMTFRTEAGFYYSYYKTIVSASSFKDGLNLLINDTGTEYPSHINALQRFNVYPEVLIGGAFRLFRHVAESLDYMRHFKACYGISRGHGQEPVQSCVGAGDETIFYINAIFIVGGLQMGVMYLLGLHLSGTFLGGLLTVSSYFYNHGECTRVMWTPPLRESFSFFFLMIQTLLLSSLLKRKCEGKQTPRISFSLVLATVCFVLPWQFSQFVLLTQTLSLFGSYVLGFLNKSHVEPVLDSVFIGYMIGTVLQFLNTMLISSLYVSAYLAFKIILLLDTHIQFRSKLVKFLADTVTYMAVLVSYKLVSAHFLNLTDDAHIFNILKAKFTDFRDFHTLLYVCAKEFDFIQLETFYKLGLTLLLPIVFAVLVRLVYIFTLELITQRTPPTTPHNHLAYHFLQFCCYLVMAIILMRLKLFMTPYMCIMASLVASDVVLPQTPKSRYIIVTLLLGAMSVGGYKNIQAQWDIMGEYNNPDQENLFLWIQKNTPQDAVFAGTMPLMANLRLSTGRNTVNHPHYEDSGLRARTKTVYTLFSRKPGQDVYDSLRSLHVQYAVLDVHWCLNNRPKSGCAIPEIWDKEDRENEGKPTFCSQVGRYKEWFRVVFSNKTHKVVKLVV